MKKKGLTPRDWDYIITMVMIALLTALFITSVQRHNKDVKEGRYDYYDERYEK